ncbi:MAG: hypothetical protein GXW91_13970 [Clostridiales bacterium]|nr:hypothetical protein [Clostridiales bacterium]
MEEVTGKVGLKFIINVVMTAKGEIVDIFAGDFIKTHRKGSKLSEQVYGTKIPELADIVVVSSNPCNIDYWQAEKGLVARYFCVKRGGYIIFVAPCYEGMEHNHPQLRKWVKFSYREAEDLVRKTLLEDDSIDLVAADIAMANARIREKVKILIITDGLSDKDVSILGYKKFKTLQKAIDYALKENSNSKIGILPRGGDCLPYFN